MDGEPVVVDGEPVVVDGEAVSEKVGGAGDTEVVPGCALILVGAALPVEWAPL